MPVNKQSAFSKILWRIVISAVGIALILIAVFNLLLFFFGDTAVANISIRRVGRVDSGRPVSQRYEWSLDYTFKDTNGATRSGHTTRRGNDLSVKTDSKVYYFPFAPFINALESDAEPNLIQPLFIVTGIFLLFIMNRKRKTARRKSAKEKNTSEPNGLNENKN